MKTMLAGVFFLGLAAFVFGFRHSTAVLWMDRSVGHYFFPAMPVPADRMPWEAAVLASIGGFLIVLPWLRK